MKKTYGADTYTTEYTYNGLGQKATMTTLKDANTPQATIWSYNNRGFMTAKTFADNNNVTYTYTADGQLLTRTWARQVNNQALVTTYSYDAAGRQTGYSYSDGVTPSVSLTLNFLDQPTGITDAAGTRNFSYNTNHLLTNETNPVIVDLVQNYGYDTAKRRSSMTLVNGNITYAQAAYSFDTSGRVATVGNGDDTLTYTYRPGMNQLASTAWTTATGNNQSYDYDAYHHLTDIKVNNVSVYGYTVNAKNQRTAATLGNGDNWAYTYDTLGQLTLAQKFDSSDTLIGNHAFAFDLIGNRTSADENSIATSYTANIVNQYTAINTDIPTYDADGNMLTYNGWAFAYNAENRLITANNSGTGVRVEADYDYMGRRIFKKVYVNNTLTSHRKFAYDTYKLIAEFDALNNDSKIASYLWQVAGLDVPLLRNDEYYVVDGNKNVIELRDSSGTVTDNYSYDPFGKVTHNGGSDNPFQFSSEYHDAETSLVYYNYRYYTPGLGRWINRDPIEEESFEVFTFIPTLGKDKNQTLYGFVSNSPIDKWDYLGLKYQICCYQIWWTLGLVRHCEFVHGNCQDGPGWTAYPVIRKKTGKMDNGVNCKCATMEDIEACAGTGGAPFEPIKRGEKAGRYGQGAGGRNGGGWGDNCQTDALRILRKCCLEAPTWTPNAYAGNP